MLDLSSLTETKEPISSGKPLEIELSKIIEDPDQPRKEFDQEALNELASSIKQRGVKSPISVRTGTNNNYIINYGARRFKASIMAGKTSIPAFIDEQSNDYDQVIENEQRENLSPLELGLFIQKKINEGIKNNEIAKMLSKPNSVITEHLALVNAPDIIMDAYRSGKIKSPRAIYNLVSLYKTDEEIVIEFINSNDEITQTSIKKLSENIKNNHENAGSENYDQTSKLEETTNNGSFTSNISADDNSNLDVQNNDIPYHNPSIEKDNVFESTDKIKKPLLLCEVDNREAMVLLNKKPTTGKIFVKFEDNSEELEVDAANIILKYLGEK